MNATAWTLAMGQGSRVQRWPTCPKGGPAQGRPCLRLDVHWNRRWPELQQTQHHPCQPWQQPRGQYAVVAGFAMHGRVVATGKVRCRISTGVPMRRSLQRHGQMIGMQRTARIKSRPIHAHRLARLRLAQTTDQRSHQHQRHRQTGKQVQQPVTAERTQHRLSVCRRVLGSDGCSRCATGCRTLDRIGRPH
ncbi:hypothetical protein PD885_00550 [Xanthomonas fragariae]|uniref:Uncharacterized protein n=1 Tax=Xanthomonas fragariae TaxID=48664 RepID=A0ABY1RKL2_9XANT|nr:hypothetical protein PD885_00550 [Xanthomonas fragariae]